MGEDLATTTSQPDSGECELLRAAGEGDAGAGQRLLDRHRGLKGPEAAIGRPGDRRRGSQARCSEGVQAAEGTGRCDPYPRAALAADRMMVSRAQVESARCSSTRADRRAPG